MRYISYIHVKSTPDKEPSIPLGSLPEKLEKVGLDLYISAKLLETYAGYQLEPDNDPDALWRMNVIAGSSKDAGNHSQGAERLPCFLCAGSCLGILCHHRR